MELLEREPVVRTIEALVAATDRGTGSLVLLSGEAGAGKTAVVAEVAHRVEGRALVLTGACDPLSTPRPLGPIRDLLASVEGDDDAFELRLALDGGDDPVVGYEALADWLAHRDEPVLIVVEDLHWADAATTDAIRFLGRRVGRFGAVVVCTYRSEEVGQPVRMLLGELGSLPASHRLVVEPLSVRAVERLSGLSGPAAVSLHRSTGGNAFFVTEVAASGQAVPTSVQDAVLARVGRLEPAAQRAVELASVSPGRMEVDLLREVGSAGRQAVDGAVAAGVLVAEGPAVRFRHELARAAVESSLPPARRLDLHRSVLRALESDGASDLARLAHHAIEAGDREAVRRLAAAAAHDAARRGAPRQAATLFEHAIAAAGRQHQAEVADLELALCEVRYLLEDLAEAEAAAERARRIHAAAGRQAGVVSALVRKTQPQWASGRPAEARRSIDEAKRRALALDDGGSAGGDSGNPDDHDDRRQHRGRREHGDHGGHAGRDGRGTGVEHHGAVVAAHLVSAQLHMLARAHQPAVDDLAIARQALTSAPDATNERRLRLLTAMVEVATGDADRGLDELARIREELQVTGEVRNLLSVLDGLGSGAGEQRRYGVALEALDEGRALADSRDEDWWAAYCRAWTARIAFEQGRWDDVGPIIDDLARRRGWVTVVRLTGEGTLGRLRVRRGEAGGAELLRATLDEHAGSELQHVWPLWCGLAEHAWLTGRSEEVPSILEGCYERALASDSEWARGEVAFWRWRAGGLGDPPDGAATPFTRHMAGDWRGAAEEWAAIGCPYERALALADGDEAAKLEAVAVLDQLGAAPAASMVRGELRRSGATTVPRGPIGSTRANPAGLTPRQLDVLRLMAAGSSNGEIADQLFITKKTVEHHVSAVLSKLGVASRARAIAAARQLGVVPET